MNSREIPEIKDRIMRYLIADEEIVALVDPTHEVEYPDDLLYRNLFPFYRVPDTEQEVRTYITVLVTVPSLPPKNDILRNVIMTIRVYTHEDMMRVPGRNGDRIDLIGARIDELLNESMDFGVGYVTLTTNSEHALDSKHSYRELIFRTMAVNHNRTGENTWR